ncbi:Fic family protein [Denitromonas sp. IR12]|uniref:Fic family protein n=2 Tax=Denitromonas iodatirespirans TaxID=2795389 RepID=A0A944DH95_DENI1|nr:Fic family protein [Denitromonas iodatirespirans]
MSLASLTVLTTDTFETVPVFKHLTSASRALAELKGLAASMPNEAILITTLAMQEAKDSSAIENIVTTHDDLFKDDAFPDIGNPAAKEVRHYLRALDVGAARLRKTGLITTNDIIEIQTELERNRAGLRKLPGTSLKDGFGETVYTPPQDPDEVLALMRDLEAFINDSGHFDADPLVKMAIIHHQFESIHPFYDGNGRTGRIVNVLYLMQQGLLDVPVLYLSRHIVRNKAEYYRLLQAVRDTGEWEAWVCFMLRAVEHTARHTMETVTLIRNAVTDAKHRIRTGYKFYSQDLINSLFRHPYTKIEFIENDLKVSRLTATKYLDALCAGGFLEKHKLGRSNYYVNLDLNRILTRDEG